MKRVYSILIFALCCVSAFAQKEFTDTITANNAGRYQTKELLKQKQIKYKSNKINTIEKKGIKINGEENKSEWYVVDVALSEYGTKANQGYSESKFDGFEYDEIKAKDGFDVEYTLYKKKESKWNTQFNKKGWKYNKNDAGEDAVEIKVKKADDTDGVLYGKLSEIDETKDLISQEGGYLSISNKESGQEYSDTTIMVNDEQVKLYKKKIAEKIQVIEKPVEMPTTPAQPEPKSEPSQPEENDSNVYIPVILLLVALVVALLLFRKQKSKKMKKNANTQPQQTVTQQPPTPTVITPAPTVTPPTPPVIPPTPPVIPPTPPVIPPTLPKPPIPTENIAFAVDADEWIVVGASVTGNGHISTNLPCQDYHKYEYLGEGWGIAVVSDGAGSAANSHIGSKIVVERTLSHFKNLIISRNLIKKNELPIEAEWTLFTIATLKAVRNDMAAFAQKQHIELKSLYATVIVVIHTPEGILAAHIGDGRAGYKNQQGEWKALITPHKGEEANQTIFVPSDFWDITAYKMSGVLVPESIVIKEKAFAFTLMSDGCESTSWLYNQQDEKTGKFFDPNKPYPNFFNPLEETLQSFRKDKINEQERADKWKKFIESGNPSFVKETDDKTMIIGVVYL